MFKIFRTKVVLFVCVYLRISIFLQLADYLWSITVAKLSVIAFHLH